MRFLPSGGSPPFGRLYDPPPLRMIVDGVTYPLMIPTPATLQPYPRVTVYLWPLNWTVILRVHWTDQEPWLSSPLDLSTTR
ncbi:ORF3 [Feline stool-associated circular virus]|nr:ORF3 [Feline stool-associated circular virus]